MTIPTEPIGSIPRPRGLIEALGTIDSTDPQLEPVYEAAIQDTNERFEATGSPVITDGEQSLFEPEGGQFLCRSGRREGSCPRAQDHS